MWDVRINKTVEKRLKKIPKETAESFFLLLRDLKAKGPDVKSWPNYSKMVNKKEVYHCHLNKNKPRFVGSYLESNGFFNQTDRDHLCRLS